jgi:hypothetical protein
MDEGTERPGLFAKGGVGRFLLALAIGAILVVALVCGVGTVITGAVLGKGFEHYFETHDDELGAASDEGRAFAAGRTITECVNESQHRAASCTSLMSGCAMPLGMFGGACVGAAQDDGYCATVPAPGGFSTRAWRSTSCAASPGFSCEAVMGAIQMGCDERTKKETSGHAEMADAPDPE